MKFRSLRHVPTRRRTIKTTARGFIYWILCLISTKPTVTQWIDETSIRYTVPLNTFFSRYLCKYQTYEPVITNILIDIFSKNKEGLYVDVGANFGWYTCLFSKFAGISGLVVAIEPESTNLTYLNQNIIQNKVTNSKIFPVAVGSKRSKLPLHRGPSINPGMFSFVEKKDNLSSPQDTIIDVYTLDQILEFTTAPIRLIKMDVEGFEIDALMGACQVLKRCESLLVEYTPNYLKSAGHDPKIFFELILSAGLVPYQLVSGRLSILNKSQINNIVTNNFDQQDFLCLRPS
jgi:FkbM family methyltransferase